MSKQKREVAVIFRHGDIDNAYDVILVKTLLKSDGTQDFDMTVEEVIAKDYIYPAAVSKLEELLTSEFFGGANES